MEQHETAEAKQPVKYSVFDPCSARHSESLEGAVRKLAEQTGLILEELPKGDIHGCCGYGGNVSEANADFATFVARTRSELSDNPYLVYCINCRDIFAGAGKPVHHILDLLFGINMGSGKIPNLTQRRHNRADLKEMLLKDIWGETMEKKYETCKLKLNFGEGILEKMGKLKILAEDVCLVIEQGEASKRQAFDPQKETYSCYRELGYITCWVEYRRNGGEYEVVNVYTHRMKIKLEEVWNGRKIEIDL